MGRAHSIAGPHLLSQLYERGHKCGVTIVGESPWDNEGNRLIQVMSNQLSPGYHGMQNIIIEGDGFWFQKDLDV